MANLAQQQTSPQKQTNVLHLIEEMKQFNQDPLSKQKAELESTLGVLEQTLSTVLVPASNNKINNDAFPLLGATITTSETESPLSVMLQSIRADAYDTHNYIQLVRGRIAAIIDRIHL